MRLRAIVRSRTRCMRRFSRSRSARSSSDGSQSAGTSSRRESSASSRASTLSVLARQRREGLDLARVGRPRPPSRQRLSRSRTQRAPLIISTHALTSRPVEDEPGEPVPVGGWRPFAGDLAARRERAPLRVPISPIDSDILQRGPPSRWDSSPERVSGEEALPMTFHNRLHTWCTLLIVQADRKEKVVNGSTVRVRWRALQWRSKSGLSHGGGLLRASESARAANVLQASGFRGDVTVCSLNAAAVAESSLEPAFRRNEAARVYPSEAAHNPEVAGSNPAPRYSKGPAKRGFCRRRLRGARGGGTSKELLRWRRARSCTRGWSPQ